MALTSTDNPNLVISVGELNRQVRIALERTLPSCRVLGEIANYSRAGSGHWYFTLKDGQASVRCVMFRPRNQFVDWIPRDGDQVEIRAQPTLYEQRGDYQLLVDTMRKAGQGALFEAFLKLKGKLESEGLFSLDRKRAIPKFPRTIGIVTSLQAAALRDVLTTLRSRWAMCRVILYPAPVQGDDAPKALVAAISTAGRRHECDVLLLVRGGGSLEDLSAFNEETLARSIAACPIPVISGVGHETDFTISDFVADLRAPTPTGAAQMATPSRIDLGLQFEHLRSQLDRGFLRMLHSLSQQLDGLRRRVAHPRERVELQRQQLMHMDWRIGKVTQDRVQHEQVRLRNLRSPLSSTQTYVTFRKEGFSRLRIRLADATVFFLKFRQERLQNLDSHLELLSPIAVLARGYSIVRDEWRQVICDSSQVKVGQSVEVVLGHGHLGVTVIEVE